MKIEKSFVYQGSCLLLILTVVSGALAFAAPVAKKWLFKDKKEMVVVAATHINNPRATYYIIMRATKRNLSSDTAVAYSDLLKQNETDPLRQSAYAFSHFVATGPLSPEFSSGQRSALTRKLDRDQLGAKYFREAALTAKPDSPDVLLQTALPMLYETGKRSEALVHLRKAAKLAPEWAEAQYWLGHGLIFFGAGKPQPEAKTIGEETLVAYQKAEKLQPKLRVECLIGYAYAYQAMNQLGKQLQYLDAYIKAKPAFGKQPGVIKWRRNLVEELAKKRQKS